MAYVDDMRGIVERLAAIDFSSREWIDNVKRLKMDASHELTRDRYDPSMTATRALAIASRKEKAARRQREIYPKIKEARASGCKTLKDICFWLEENGVKAASGDVWHPSTVKAIEDAGVKIDA